MEDEPTGCFGGCILSFGEAVTVFQAQTGCSCVSHRDVGTGQIHKIATRHTVPSLVEPLSPTGMCILPVWAPFPSAWGPVYAYIHSTSTQDPAGSADQVNLVDTTSHRLLGSWTLQDLQHLPRRPACVAWDTSENNGNCYSPPFCDLSWAPNSRQLARSYKRPY